MNTGKTTIISTILAAVLILSTHLTAHAQDDFMKRSNEDKFIAYSQLLSPEKLYLHTDREVYCAGDTIWMKGYLFNASELAEFPACNYIYVELIASMVEKNVNTGRTENQEYVRKRVKIKRSGNSFSGYLPIPENMNTGVAVLRGYSYWMLNFQPNYMFYKNIELRNPMKDDFVVSMTDEKIRDTYKYTDIGVENPYDKKVEKKMDIDVQFLPESGRYLAGIQSVIGVKAVGEDGLGVGLTGEIFADDQKIGAFRTNDAGMGRMIITVPVGTRKVYAMVTDGQDFNSKESFPMPEEKAVVINMQVATDGATVVISHGGFTLPESTSIVIHDKNEIYMQMAYDEGSTAFKIGYDDLSDGINNLAVIDGEGNVYAERSFFVFPKNGVKADIALNKQEYGPRDHVKGSVKLADADGKPLNGDFSISVSDDSYAPYSGKNYNVVSYHYLGSELKSFVENPQSYFDESIPLNRRMRDLDLVMLTQGWKYYDLPKILNGESMMPACGKEYTQSISGVVRGTLKNAKKSIVSFIAPSIGFSAMGQLDTTGWFALNGLDFPEGTQFVVGAVSLGGSTKRYTPILDDDVFARYFNYPKYMQRTAYADDYKYAALSDYYNNGGEIVYSLNPSYISGARVRKQQNISPLPNYEFKEGQYRGTQELQPYEAYDLMTYIVTTCPPLRFSSPSDDVAEEDSTAFNDGSAGRSIVCRIQRISSEMSISSGWGEILVFINGMKSTCADLEGLTVADITGFAYITGADASKFNASVDDALMPRSVVMIQSKMYDHDSARNVSAGTPIGWQKPARFYAPRYDSYASKKNKEPMRSTLYWNPELEIMSGEGAEFDFYTSDHKVPYTVVVEGFTETGVPVFAKTEIIR